MKATLSFGKDLLEKAINNVCQPLPVILPARQKRMLLIGVLLSHIFFTAFSQEAPVFLSRYDSCQMHPPQQTPLAMEALSVGAPMVRVAYVIPSNRTPQPNGVANLQHAIKTGRQFFKEQMEQNGFGPKTFIFETEGDGVTPLIHVVHVAETDEYLRGDLWGRAQTAASNAGISLWAPGEVWVVIPETHVMFPDGSGAGGVALGAGWGSGNGGGVSMIGSNALPLFHPSMITDDTPYDGKVLPELGSYPMKQDVTFAWFEGTTFSSVASSWLGALWHETGHAFGLGHDFRNDNNFHGNLMGNGLRGTRGTLYPEKYPQDYTRLEYWTALFLNVSHFFNSDKMLTNSPTVSHGIQGSVTPQQGLVHLPFQASDPDGLSFAYLVLGGDMAAEMLLEGTTADTTFAVPYFTQGNTNGYTIFVVDTQGNKTAAGVQFNVPGGNNQAPFPFIRIDPPVPGLNQPIVLNATQSYDLDHDQSSLLASWDVDNDGQFDTEPTTNKTIQYQYENPGNYLIRLKLTDPAGAQTISTAVSIKIPGEKKIAVESFSLIDAEKDEAVVDLQDGLVIDPTAWEGKTFSVRANTSTGMIDRVEFELKGPITYHRAEKIPPYSLFGDSPNGDYNGRKLLPGEYTLTATPFFHSEKGIALTVSFHVKNGSVPGQPAIAWDKTLGGTGTDMLGSAISTPDGGYLLAGHSSSDSSGDKSENGRGFSDYWIVKIDAQHNKLWDKTFGGEGVEELRGERGVIAAPDGGYLLAGYSTSNASGDKSENSKGSADYWVVKIDNQGNKVWDKTFGGDAQDLLYSMFPTPDGGYLLAGSSQSNISGDKSAPSKGSDDYWVVKIDSHGNKIWDKTFGGSSIDELQSVTATVDGYLLGGNSLSEISGDKTSPSKGSNDYWVLKIDNQGNKVWDKTIGGSDFDRLASTIHTPDGGYLLAGFSWSNASGDKSEDSKGAFDFWVVKIDATGNKIWDKTFGGNLSEFAASAVAVPSGGYLLSGTSGSDISGDKSENSKGIDDYWVVKIDNQGNKVWDKTIGGSGFEFLNSTILTPTDGYLLAGYSRSNASGDKSEDSKGDYDYWIVELKPPSAPAVTTLTLMNAHTDQEIKELKDGDSILLAEVGSKLLNIRANITDENIKKVAFHLKGPINHHQTERIVPYELFGDQGGKLLPGEYTLTVTPFINDTKGAALTISFTVTDGFAISGFTLIDATTDQAMGPLSEGDVIDLSLLKGHKLSVLVDTQPMRVEKVDLTLQGPIVYSRTESYLPYTLFGDLTKDGCSTDYEGLKLVPGTYNLTATPYAHGVKGTPYTITFSIISGGIADDGCRKIEVFPLPASGVINIIHEGKSENTHMFLLDFNGNVLLHRPLSQQPVEQLDVSAYRKGIHYLKVVSPEGLQIIRLVVE